MVTQVYVETEGFGGNKTFDRSEFDGVCKFSAYLKKWIIKSSFELEGSGVKQVDKIFKDGKLVFEYLVTLKTFDVLAKEMNLLQEMLLD